MLPTGREAQLLPFIHRKLDGVLLGGDMGRVHRLKQVIQNPNRREGQTDRKR